MSRVCYNIKFQERRKQLQRNRFKSNKSNNLLIYLGKVLKASLRDGNTAHWLRGLSDLAGIGFYSHHLHGGSQLSVSTVPGV